MSSSSLFKSLAICHSKSLVHPVIESREGPLSVTEEHEEQDNYKQICSAMVNGIFKYVLKMDWQFIGECCILCTSKRWEQIFAKPRELQELSKMLT